MSQIRSIARPSVLEDSRYSSAVVEMELIRVRGAKLKMLQTILIQVLLLKELSMAISLITYLLGTMVSVLVKHRVRPV